MKQKYVLNKHKIQRPDGEIEIEELENKNKIKITLIDNKEFSPNLEYETSYPINLIEKIAAVKGAAWVCNEIMREECPGYIPNVLKHDILSYIHPESLNGKKILDFGCGCGASSIILARMFPESFITGVEYVKEYVEICEMRREFMNFSNLEFYVSPSSEDLPEKLGEFDYILLSGVFEHFLEGERKKLFPKIWGILKKGGIMFLNGTPHRYFPVEIHTTSGLPFINYFPQRIAHFFAKRFSKRGLQKMSWEELLRNGIRGGSPSEILRILKLTNSTPILLKPKLLNSRDRIDLWYKSYGSFSHSKIKKIIFYLLKGIRSVSGIELTPYLSLAIKKI